LVEQRLSVIIPVWNGGAFLPDCLEALEAQSDTVHEIIAVDNGSTDGSAELIAGRYSHVRLFRNTQNLGFAQACNTGMRAATGDVFVLLNQDTLVEPGWSTALQAAFADTGTGIVGCKILSAADRSLQHAGGYVHELLGMPFHYGKEESDDGLRNTPREVEYVTGAAMAVQRGVVEHIGLLDERFFPAYYEDVDFCFRAREMRFKVIYWPDAVVFHHESTSTPSETRWFYFQRGRIRFVLKHWPFDRLVNGFGEAEAGFQTVFRTEFGSTRPLRLAYTAARIEAPAIVAERWPAGGNELARINEVLCRLHAQALAVELAQLHLGQSVPNLSEPSRAASAPQTVEAPIYLHSLTEHEFRSAIPVLGWVIAAVRRTWYAIAAKWAIQHLMNQQQAINQATAGYLQQLERRTADLLSRQETMFRFFSDQMRDYLEDRERHAAATNRFLLDSISQAEEEAIFALLWPLRWDLVITPTTSRKAAP